MASTETLTSLAILKVSIDRGQDYLDYLRPFILQVLVDQRPDPVTDKNVRDYLRTQFGLQIPDRTIQIVLKRISRSYPLKRDCGVYRITDTLPNPGIPAKKSEAERHINAVVSGLIEFSKNTPKPISKTDEAVTAICTFLSEFNILYLRAYLQRTTIPAIKDKQYSHIVLVSEYVLHLQQVDPERFDSFLIMLQGHMLANALLCPDIQNAPKTYNGVTFFLDTPLLVHLFNLEGKAKQHAINELISLLHNLGGKVATFSHLRQELEAVIKGAAHNVDDINGRGAIIAEARRSGTTKSDLLLLAGKSDELLKDSGIEIVNAPEYIAKFQIDEKAFDTVLDDEVSYYNPRAKQNDINSVRCIYVLRKSLSPSTLEKCKAVLVTDNSGFSRAAYEYGKNHEESKEVSSVITDFSLANIAWLKAPLGAPSLPTTELLAFSYAALRPSKELLDKYLGEIDKLEKQGKISARDHQLLRSSTLAQKELMQLTLGDEVALTEETVTETLRRVSEEIKREETEKLTAEQAAHRKTQFELATERAKKEQIQKQLFWRCQKKAQYCAWGISGFISILIICGIVAGFGLKEANPAFARALLIGSSALAIGTIANLIFGSTVLQLHNYIEERCLKFCLKRVFKSSGINLESRL